MRSPSFSKLILAIPATLLLAGCVATWDYPKGPVASGDKSYTLTLPQGWAYIPSPIDGSIVATRDGTALQRIEVRSFDIKKELPFAKEKLTSEMGAEQLVELYFKNAFKDPSRQGATMERAGPALLGGMDGFELTYSYTTGGGLRYRESTVGAIRNGKLVTVSYRAPTRHYYDRDDDVMPAALASFTFNP